MGPQGDMGGSHVAGLSALLASAWSGEGLQHAVRTAGLRLYPVADVLVGNKLSARSAGCECAYLLGIQNCELV